MSNVRADGRDRLRVREERRAARAEQRARGVREGACGARGRAASRARTAHPVVVHDGLAVGARAHLREVVAVVAEAAHGLRRGDVVESVDGEALLNAEKEEASALRAERAEAAAAAAAAEAAAAEAAEEAGAAAE
ncbi:MAG: hypothetical protein QGF33_13745 [Alphaproteobacteria bacterium]|nr:hypothetical protein [Alphaproteobacteria bacterium]